MKEKGVSRTSISRTKEQEEQEKARTRIQCVLRGINELSRRRRREAGLPQLTAERPATSTARGPGERGTRAAKQEAVAGCYGGDRLEFRVGRQRAAPPSFAPPPNSPRPRPTLAGSLRFHPRSLLSLPPRSPAFPPCSSRAATYTRTFVLSRLSHNSSPNSLVPEPRGVLLRACTRLADREPGRTGMLAQVGEWISASHTWTKVDRKIAVLDWLRGLTGEIRFCEQSCNILSSVRHDSRIFNIA